MDLFLGSRRGRLLSREIRSRSMYRPPSRDKRVVWTAATSVWIVGAAAGWYDLIWPYYVLFVVALVAFQLWYFRDAVRGRWHGSRSR